MASGSRASSSPPMDEGVMLKVTRSSSEAYGGIWEGAGPATPPPLGFPPVLVMYHPSMKAMATRLVHATTMRMEKLKLQSNVSRTGQLGCTHC